MRELSVKLTASLEAYAAAMQRLAEAAVPILNRITLAGYGEPGHLGVQEVTCEEDGLAAFDPPGLHEWNETQGGYPCPRCKAEV